MSDRDLLKAIRHGDTVAFRQVFDACYEGLCGYACTMLKDMDEAEDLVQSLFLKLWEKRNDISIEQTVRSYLFKAVYHQCLNQLEHRSVQIRHQQYKRYENQYAVQRPDVFPEELEENIRQAIESLPEQCRIIFNMSRYEELKYAEIAARLGLSVNTVENQVSKALKILRAKIKTDTTA